MLTLDPQKITRPQEIPESVIQGCPSPCFVVDEARLRKNLSVFDALQKQCGVEWLLALKAFAMFSTFPELRKVLQGTTASSLHEARLGVEEFKRDVHGYAVALIPGEVDEWFSLINHCTFNSLGEWDRYQERAKAAGVSRGIRLNPEYSEVRVDLYNPSRPGSRLGVRAEALKQAGRLDLDGIHVHGLCEQGADVLERVWQRVEAGVGSMLDSLSWINLGGGHLITQSAYEVDRLARLVETIRTRYGVRVIMEPGQTVAMNAGFLVATVLDVIDTGEGKAAILDTSASAHMPDILEMPYRPHIVGSGEPGEKTHAYRLGGITCLAGDEMGAYSFDAPLEAGQRLVFTDMAHYTMVKTTHFNGLRLPSIGLFDSEQETSEFRLVREFGYSDYRNRLS